MLSYQEWRIRGEISNVSDTIVMLVIAVLYTI